MPAKTLVVAPRPKDLFYADKEVQQIVNLLNADLLLGDVGHNELMQRLRAGYEYIFFPTHMTDEGLLLSEEPPIFLDAATLTQYLRHAPPALIALNTCHSLAAAADLVEEMDTTVICTTVEIPDLLAFTTLAQLAYYLATGYTIGEAYRLSKPAMNREYRMIGHGGGGSRIEQVLSAIHALRGELARTNTRLDDLQEEQARTSDRLGALEESVERSVRLSPRWPLLWSAYGIILFILALAYVDVRTRIAFSWQASWVVSALLVLVVSALGVTGSGIPLSSIKTKDQES